MKKTIMFFTKIVVFSFFFLSCQQSADEYYNSAMESAKNKDIESMTKTLESLDKAIEINPRLAKAYLERGKINFRMQYLKSIIKDTVELFPLLEAIESDPMYERALNDYDKAFELDSDLLNDVLINKGTVYLVLNEYQKALPNLVKSLTIDPNNKEVIGNAARCKFLLQDTSGAVILMDQLVGINPNDAENYYNRAIFRVVDLKDTEGGCEDLNKALRLFDANKTYGTIKLSEKIENLMRINCDDDKRL